MINIFKQKKIGIKNMFLILLLTMCLQNIKVVSFGTFSLKLYHVVSLLFLPMLVKRKNIIIPNKAIVFFFVYIMTVSVINIPINGFSSLILNYIFGFYIMIIIFTLGADIKVEDWLEIIRKVATIMICLVFLRFLKHIDYLTLFLKNVSLNGHPDTIGTYFGGGANLEATWIALLGFGFFKNKKQYIYFICSLLVSIIYVSRVGIVLNVILLGWISLQSFEKKDFKKLISKILIIMIFTFIALLIFYKMGLLDYILTRLLSIGDSADKGTSGRFGMWKYVGLAAINNPFGYGIGNAIDAVANQGGRTVGVANVHNIYFQMLLDAGWFGFAYYFFIIVAFLKKEVKNFFRNPFVAFIITYLIVGLIQFRGGDVLLFFVLGIYIISEKRFKQVSE